MVADKGRFLHASKILKRAFDHGESLSGLFDFVIKMGFLLRYVKVEIK
jgi:hypothetical protein